MSTDIITEASNHHKTNQRLAHSGDFKEAISEWSTEEGNMSLDAHSSKCLAGGKYPSFKVYINQSPSLPSTTMAKSSDHPYREQPGLFGVAESNTSTVRSGFYYWASDWLLEQYPQQHTPFYRRRDGIIIIIVIIIIVIGAIVGGALGGSALTAQRDDTTAAAVPSQVITTVTTSTTVTLSAPSPSPSNCVWEGTAPFCDGKCLTGFTQIKEDNCGSGDCCSIGFKVYCCQQWKFRNKWKSR